MQARKTTHGVDGQHQDVDRTPRGRVNHNDRGHLTVESYMVIYASNSYTYYY